MKVVLVTEELAPSRELKEEKGVHLVTGDIDELNYFLKK